MSYNALFTFNLFSYIWFPLFKLPLFNHTEAAIRRCPGKTAFLELTYNQQNIFGKYQGRSPLLSFVLNF